MSISNSSVATRQFKATLKPMQRILEILYVLYLNSHERNEGM